MMSFPFVSRPAARRSAVAAALALAVWPSMAATQPAPPRRIAEVMARPDFAHASWGMEFYDLQSGRTVFAHNRQQLFVPGSTTKVVTMATALEVLGPDHRFRTRLYRTGPVVAGVVQGDLVLVASGDPNLSGRARPDGSYAFIDQDHSYSGQPLADDPLTVIKAMAAQVAARGIRGVTGQVVVDASLFAEGARELGTRVTLSPLVINDNVIDLVVTPGASAGAPATVTVSPQTSYLTVQATLTTADSGSAPAVRMVEDSTNRDHRVLVITGRVPRGAPSNPRWVIPSPSRFGEIVLAEALRAAGVSAIPRLATRRAEPAALRGAYVDSLLVAEHVSLPLLAEARVLLKTSQNLHASNFPLLLAGLEAARDPSRDPSRTGFDIARELMVKNGLDLEGAVQGDGAGGDAYFSPAFMTRFLAMMWQRPYAAGFKAAMPTLGVDGTLATIQKGSPGAGKVFAKTGTYGSYDPLNRRQIIHGKGLAGYFTTRSGREIAFAIYVNNVAAKVPDPAVLAGQALGEIASIAWETIR
jgi:D-alanyl-D-alanine carboxypeptidase/D-alanyl-D-alanine-endopeptidase (penicillin-binding protein 4)